MNESRVIRILICLMYLTFHVSCYDLSWKHHCTYIYNNNCRIFKRYLKSPLFCHSTLSNIIAVNCSLCHGDGEKNKTKSSCFVSYCLLFSVDRFNVALKVFCDVNYYGPECTVYCVPRDDDTGHFTCDPLSGRRLCRFGKGVCVCFLVS